MRVALTGTPGTGKTSAVAHLDTDLEVVHLNEEIQDHDLYSEVDEARNSVIADIDAIRDYLDGMDDVLVESHLAHYLDVDRMIVLRCRPDILEQRLLDRGESPEKARENAESEALDVILVETLQRHDEDRVYELETTDDTPSETAEKIKAVVDGERSSTVGIVDYTDHL